MEYFQSCRVSFGSHLLQPNHNLCPQGSNRSCWRYHWSDTTWLLIRRYCLDFLGNIWFEGGWDILLLVSSRSRNVTKWRWDIFQRGPPKATCVLVRLPPAAGWWTPGGKSQSRLLPSRHRWWAPEPVQWPNTQTEPGAVTLQPWPFRMNDGASEALFVFYTHLYSSLLLGFLFIHLRTFVPSQYT